MALPGHHETTEMRDPQISRGRFEGNESMDRISDAHVVSFLKSSIAFWTLRIVIGSPYLSASCFTWSTLPQTKPPAAWLVARGTPLHLRSKLRNPAATLKSQEITNIAEDSSTKLRLESSYSAEDLHLKKALSWRLNGKPSNLTLCKTQIAVFLRSQFSKIHLAREFESRRRLLISSYFCCICFGLCAPSVYCIS